MDDLPRGAPKWSPPPEPTREENRGRKGDRASSDSRGTIPSPAQAAALAVAARSTRLTGRAALLAVVICAIALSLAYPVREYIAQRQQIDQLLAERQAIAAQVKALREQNVKLTQTWYIEQQARDELHMCFPNERCYEVTGGQPASAAAKPRHAPANPWYAKLWASVRRADAKTAR